MEIKKTSTQVIHQLITLLKNLDDEQYSRPLTLLSGNSIGKHVRHIIELYFELLCGYENDVVNYDDRDRDVIIETECDYAVIKLEQIIDWTKDKKDKELRILLDYTMESNSREAAYSSFKRELAYNIEHAIHHMAIIKIAVGNSFSAINLEPTFGVAPSTIRHQKTCAQ
jgi:hypothetical protein